MNKTLKYILLTSLFITPIVSFAALSGVTSLLVDFGGILNTLLRVLFALALVYFFWGAGQFILNSGDQKTREEGQQRMIWGIVALFVMVSIIGILSLIGGTLGIDTSLPTNSRGSGTPGLQNIIPGERSV